MQLPTSTHSLALDRLRSLRNAQEHGCYPGWGVNPVPEHQASSTPVPEELEAMLGTTWVRGIEVSDLDLPA
ncbi:MAG: hypothetical protein AAFU79_08740 [Myxococcota bacterium]